MLIIQISNVYQKKVIIFRLLKIRKNNQKGIGKIKKYQRILNDVMGVNIFNQMSTVVQLIHKQIKIITHTTFIRSCQPVE